MASEPRDRGSAPELPDSLDEWLQRHAEETDASADELLAELVAAYRVAVDGQEVEAAALADAMDLDTRIQRRHDDLREDFEDRLEALDERNREAFETVRKRIVQLKDATESKAPADHTHEELDRVETLTEDVVGLESAVEQLRSTVSEHGETLQAVEEDLEDVGGKLRQVARTVVELRYERDAGPAGEPGAEPSEEAGEETAEGPDPLTAIKREAAREGIERADCESCGETVTVAPLPEAACPHCGAPFGGVRKTSRLFENSRLVGPKSTGESREEER